LFGAWPIALIVLLWPSIPKTSEQWAGAALSAAGFVSLIPLVGVYPHYAAAFAPAFFLRFLQGLARLGSWCGRWGYVAVGAVIAIFVLSGRDDFSTVLADRSADFGAARAAMDRRLTALPGKQLVLVRYGPGHNTQNEWVFNAADIGASKVIWAREMTQDQDRPFLNYYRDRQAWLLEADQNPPRLSPYPRPEADTQARR
jgi:hypothetical protein